jgi:virulence-associated protein VagC
MATARVFRHGNSQAVQLPKEFRLKGKEWKFSAAAMRLYCARR